VSKKRANGEGTIYRTPSGRWRGLLVIGRDPETGKLRRVSISGRTRQEVATKLAEIMTQKEKGLLVEPSRMTVAQWLDVWLENYKRPVLRPRTFDSYQMMLRAHIKPAIGEIQLQDLRPDHLQALYNGMMRRVSNRTTRYAHMIIRQALQQALRNNLVVRNVADIANPPREKKPEIKPLTPDQLNRFLGAIKDDRLQPAYWLMLQTGLRRGELLALTWDDIDWENSLLHVRKSLLRINTPEGPEKTAIIITEPKTPASKRTVPLAQETLDLLRKWKSRQAQEKLLLGAAYQDQGLVFCREDGVPLDPDGLTRHFQRTLRRAGLPKARLHDLRHTFATRLLELGENPKTVQTILGHSRIQTTLDTYSHVSLELERRAVERLAKALKKESPS